MQNVKLRTRYEFQVLSEAFVTSRFFFLKNANWPHQTLIPPYTDHKTPFA